MSTKYRGMQVAPKASSFDVNALFDFGANIIRYQINGGGAETFTNQIDYFNWVREHIEHIKVDIFPTMAAGEKIVVCLFTPFYGRDAQHKHRIFTDKLEAQETVIRAWEMVAAEFKGKEEIYGYDVLNEPAGDHRRVTRFMTMAVKRIRKIDSKVRILVSCPYSIPSKFKYTAFQKQDKYCAYVLHMYSPMNLTHQGIYGKPTGVKYPFGKYNKKYLRDVLKPVRAFQQKNRARIFMNEFSISTFADIDSRVNYLTDVIAIAEEYGWHWTYHAWRESPVWDMEKEPRLEALFKKHFAKNP